MNLKLDILLDDSDYVAFNEFNSFYTKNGKKSVLMLRGLLLLILVAFVTVFFSQFGVGIPAFVATGLFATVIILYQIFLPRRLSASMRKHVQRLKKMGKLPYSPTSVMEFSDTSLVEQDPTTRSEYSYDKIEQVYVLEDSYIFIYITVMSAFIIPPSAFTSAEDRERLVSLLTEKCSSVEIRNK